MALMPDRDLGLVAGFWRRGGGRGAVLIFSTSRKAISEGLDPKRATGSGPLPQAAKLGT
jgi:hypothetical protein